MATQETKSVNLSINGGEGMSVSHLHSPLTYSGVGKVESMLMSVFMDSFRRKCIS